MAAASENGSDVSHEMLLDTNFRTLASRKTKPEEFSSLLEAHVAGYTQKKRLVDGLKDLNGKVDEAENKLSIMKAVGKAKQLEPEEQKLTENHTSQDLKEKVQRLTADIAAMLEGGQVTLEEKPKVLEHLNSRKTAAKAANKEKLLEKLERQITGVSKATPIDLPVSNIKELDALARKLQGIEALEKRPPKSLTPEDKARIEGKSQVKDELWSLKSRSRMWFESEFEFAPRLEKALAVLAVQEAEQRRLEEEQAWERRRQEEEAAVEQKKKEEKEKQEALEKKMMEKLEARRLEAQAKPQKAAPQPKKKEKKRAVQMNPHGLFSVERKTLADYEATQAQMEEAYEGSAPDEDEDEEEVEEQPPTKVNSPPVASATTNGYPTAEAEKVVAAAAAVAPPQQEDEERQEEEKPQPKKEKIVIESKWAAPVNGENGESLHEEEENAGPSLMEAVKAKETPKKTPPPAPKKKEKKKFAKMSVTDLGFDCDNPNYAK